MTSQPASRPSALPMFCCSVYFLAAVASAPDEFERDPEQVESDREWEEQENDPYSDAEKDQMGDNDQPWEPN